jgi:sugar lactone lactonase YvrE
MTHQLTFPPTGRSTFGQFYSLLRTLTSIVLGVLLISFSTQEVSAATITVTNSNSTGAGSLRQVIVDAPSGSTIDFAPSLSGGTIPLGGAVLTINKVVTIDASSLADGITIDGENTTGVFEVNTGGNATFDTLTITGGTGSIGGGIYNGGGVLTIRNCTLFGNSGFGGGIFNSSNNGPLQVTNCTITGNQGGGIYNNGGDVIVRNSTIVGNNEAGLGLGSGGGILHEFGTLLLENTIVAGNTAPSDVDISRLNSTVVTDGGGNLIGDNSSISTEFPAGALVGTTASPLDPQLAALGDYGGPSPTMNPVPGSPVIDPAGGATNSSLATDQRGFARVVDGNVPPDGTATLDIGAVEFTPPLIAITVANTNDSGAGSLRQAIADIAIGGTIDFAQGLSGQTITLGSNLSITKAVTIDGSGLSQGVTLNLDGSQFAPSGAALTLNSLDISGGGTSQYILEGFDNSPLNLLNCTIRDSGNGISLFANAPVTISNCTFTNNSTAFYYFGGSGVATIKHTTIVGNFRGIYLEAGEIVLENSIVAGNGNDFELRDDGLFTQILTNAGGNLIGNNSGLETEFPAGPLVGTSGSPLDANLFPLGRYGGLTPTMPPRLSSPAIDPAGGATTSSLGADQRGYARVIDGNSPPDGTATLDVGAVESGPVQRVTSIADSGAGSLRALLGTVNSGSVIGFDPAVFNGTPAATIVLTSELSIAGKTLSISGSGIPGGVTLSGGGSVRVLSIDAASVVAMDRVNVTNGSSDSGGGINSAGTLVFANAVVSGNSAINSGGGIYNLGSLQVSNTTVTGNTCAKFGGGISSVLGTLTVRNSTLSGNSSTTSGWGGGALFTGDSSTAVLGNVTVVGNSGFYGGGFVIRGDFSLEHGTVFGNSANSSGGIFIATATLKLQDSVIAGNTASSDPNMAAMLFTGTNNLIGGSPLLAALGDYGGLTQTMPPQLGSPAIDAGSGSFAGGSTTLFTDQRGLPRIIGAASDIGAAEALFTAVSPTPTAVNTSASPTLTWSGAVGATFEIFLGTSAGNLVSQGIQTSPFTPGFLSLDSTYFWRVDTLLDGGTYQGAVYQFTTRPASIVDTVADENDGLNTGGISLRDAVNAAVPGENITFAQGLNGQIITLGSTLSITKDLTIDASALTGGLTINNDGNTIYPDGGHVTLDSLTFDAGGNIAIEKFGSSPLTIRNATFTGGGGYVIGAFGDSPLTISNTTISENGTGLYLFTGAATTTITNSTISGNSGIGIILEAGNLVIENSIIAGNGTDFQFNTNPAFSPTLTPVGRNLIGDNTTVEAEFPAGPLVGTTASPVDPKLFPLGQYGGPTSTMVPQADSPAIDPAGGVTTSSFATDQRGFIRVVDGNNPPDGTATLDLGAVEAGIVRMVTTVADSGAGSLREALAAADLGDGIGFDLAVFDGTPAATIVLASELSINGKALSIDGSNIAGGVTVSGGGAVRVFFIDGGTVTMNRVTVTNGSAASGAGLTNYGALTLIDSAITGNTATSTNGGGISNSGDLTLNHVIISGNHAPAAGGGIYNNASRLVIRNSTISNNTSGNTGGGVALWGGVQRITNTTLAGNSALRGGGIDIIGGTSLTLENSTLFGNSATGGSGTGNGGGIHVSGTVTIKSSTLSGNSASGGGGGIYSNSNGPNLSNTIVAGNTAPLPNHANTSGVAPTGSNNLTSGDPLLAPLGDYGGPTQTMPPLPESPAINAGGSTALITDQRGFPRAVGAASDIGAVETLIFGIAPARNAGDTSPLAALTWSGASGATFELFLGTSAGSLTSQGDQTSPFTPASPFAFGSSYFWRVDTTLGGVVYPGDTLSFTIRPESIVNTLADENDGLFVNGKSLREAIDEAVPGENITFAPSLDGGTITLGGSELLIDTDITIDGSALASGITISGNNASTVFRIAPGSVATLSTLTITGGNSGGTSGGGIYNNGTLTLIRSTVSDCIANDGGAGYGGGIYQNGGSLIMTDSTISGNTANYGGGLFVNYATITIKNSTISGNFSAPNWGGAGIYNWQSTVSLANTTISGNSAGTGAGGGINSTGPLTLTNSIIAGNLATTDPNIRGAFTGTNNLTSGAPLLAPLGYYGGPTPTMPPLPGSPALNAGGSTDLLTDQRGFPRVIGGTADIGACEAGSAKFSTGGLTVTTQGPATLSLLEISTDPNFLNTISTIAGTGSAAFADGPRATAAFNHPSGVAEDGAGNLFVADTGNHRIRRIDKLTGEVSTIAGSGSYGFADGSGPTAKFAFPAAVAVVSGGSIIYVSDTFNHRIRKLTKPAIAGQPWTVTTLAGTGVAGFVEGAGASARFNHPHGLAFDDNGALLVADTFNHRIRKVTAAGVVSTYYFDNVASINQPMGLALDSVGKLFVAEPDYNLIWEINQATQGVSTFGNGVQGFQDSPARFNQPMALAMDDADNFYVSDQGNHAIRKITSLGVVTIVAGNGTPDFADGNSTIAQFNGPSGLLVASDGFLIVADTGNNRLRRVSIKPLTVATSHDAASNTLTAAIDAAALGLNPGQTYYFRWLPTGGVGGPVAGDSFHLLLPPAVVTDPATLLTSTSGQLNATVDPQGSNTEVTFEYSTDPELRGPWQVDTLAQGVLSDLRGVAVFEGITYVADETSNAIYQLDPQGVVTHFAGASNGSPGFVDGAATVARFDGPAGLAVDTVGNLYVADRLNHRIRKITPDGTVSTLAGSGLSGFADGSDDLARFYFPQGVVVFENNVYVADTGNHRIRRIDKTTGAVTTLAGKATAGFVDGAGGTAQFHSPRAVAVNAAGQLVVADTGNHCIRLLTVGNSVVTLAGSDTPGFLDGADINARFSSPAGLTIGTDGTIYVTDQDNHRIRSITTGGLVGTVAGSGIAGLLDSPVDSLHPATIARFDSPGGITLDGEGNLIVAEQGTSRLRRIARGTVPTLLVDANMTTNGPASAETDPLLLPGATYYFRAVAANARGTSEGEILSFTTLQSNIVVHNGLSNSSPLLVPGQEINFGATPFNTPEVRDFTIENIGDFALNVDGVALTGAANGVFALSGQFAEYSIAAGASGTFNVTLNHTTAGTFENTVSITSNDLDQSVIEFSVIGTVLAPPLLTNVTASDVSALGVSFAGTVDPQGSATELLFEYSKYPDFTGTLEVLTTSGSVQGFANGCGGEAQFDSPSGVAVDRFGNIYVADTGNHLIRRITANGDCGVLAGAGESGTVDGSGALAKFNAPEGLAVDAAGNVYVADTQNHRIRKITPAGEVTTLAGFGNSGSFTDGAIGGARFNLPAGIAIDDVGNLYVADTGNNRIRKISTAGEVSTLSGPIGYSSPKGIAVDRDGKLYVADTGNNRIVELTAAGSETTSHAIGFTGPTGVAVDASGTIYVADRGLHRIARINSGGVVTNLAGTPDLSGTGDGAGDLAGFNLPSGIAVSPSGTIYVADYNNHRIRQINLAARRVVAARNLITAPEGPVTLALVGLEPNTTYHYRGIAINGGGTVYKLPGEPAPLSFTTLDNNADLVQLSVNGTPVPGLNPCAYSYPVTINSQQSSMVILAQTDSPNAQIQLYQNSALVGTLQSGVQSSPLALVTGLNPFQVTVLSADGTNLRTYSIAATLVQPDSQFARWQTLKFGEDATDPLIAGPLANPDNDNSVNLFEYAFDLDPNVPSTVGLPVARHSDGFLTLTYRRRVGAADIAYVVEWSTNLDEWSEVGVTEELVTPQGEGLTEEIRSKVPDGGSSKFIRLSVQSL